MKWNKAAQFYLLATNSKNSPTQMIVWFQNTKKNLLVLRKHNRKRIAPLVPAIKHLSCSNFRTISFWSITLLTSCRIAVIYVTSQRPIIWWNCELVCYYILVIVKIVLRCSRIWDDVFRNLKKNKTLNCFFVKIVKTLV